MAIYSNLFVYVDGSLLAEAVSVATSLENSQSPVFSITGNFEGVTSGPFMRKIEVANVVPITGSELDWEGSMVEGEKVDIVLVEGGTGWRARSRGTILSVSRQGAVGKTSSLSFTFAGTAEAFSG